ncbi:MAG: hypothetical protein AAGD07_10505 [Planctomycetota bacterium]
MNDLPLGPVYEAQSHLRHEFQDFAKVWQTTRASWRDEPARQFEQQSLAPLGPTLNRVSAAIDAFVDAVRASEKALQDPDRSSD